jgi:hypothetical protein
MAVGRRLWSLNTALYVHLVAAPATAFLVAFIHKLINPGFGPELRAEFSRLRKRFRISLR